MKSNFMKVAFAIAVVMLGGTNVYNAHKCETLSDVALANVEALAEEEKHDVDCSKEGGECVVKLPKNSQLIITGIQKP